VALKIRLGEILASSAPDVLKALKDLARNLPEQAAELARWLVQPLGHGKPPKVEGDIIQILKVPPEQRPWVVVPSTAKGIPSGQIYSAIEGSGIKVGDKPLASILMEAAREAAEKGEPVPPISIPNIRVILAPTKPSPGADADIGLIRRSIESIIRKSNEIQEPIIVPLLGSGSGRLGRDESEKLLTQTFKELGADPSKFAIFAPQTSEPAIRKAIAEAASAAVQEKKIQEIAKLPKIEKPLTTGFDLPDELTMFARPHVPESGQPSMILSEKENAERLAEILRSKNFQVSVSKDKTGKQIYTVTLNADATKRAQDLQNFVDALLRQEQRQEQGNVPNLINVARIAGRLLSTYGSIGRTAAESDPITEKHIRTIIGVSQQLAKYIKDESINAVHSGKAKPKAVIDELKDAIAKELIANDLLSNITEPLTYEEVLQRTKAALVPYAYRWIHRWKHDAGQAIRIMNKAVVDILRTAGYALKEEPGEVYRFVRIASADDLASVASRVKSQADKPVDEIIVKDKNALPKLVAKQVANKLAQIEPGQRTIRIDLRVKLDDGGRWYGMIFKVNNLPKSIINVKDYNDLVKFIESVLKDRHIVPAYEIYARRKDAVPTSLVDVAVWPLRKPDDIIPKIGEKIALEDMQRGALQDWQYEIVDLFKDRRKKIEQHLLNKLPSVLVTVADELKNLIFLPEGDVAREVIKSLKPGKTKVEGVTEQILEQANRYVKAILDHLEDDPNGVLLPSGFKLDEPATENVTATVNQIAKRVAARTILDESSRHMPVSRPKEEVKSLLRSVREAVGPQDDPESGGPGFTVSGMGKIAKEISESATVPAFDVIRGLLKARLTIESAPKWDEVRTDRTMALIKSYVYGSPGVTVRTLEALKDPAIHIPEIIEGIAKTIRDDYVLNVDVSPQELVNMLEKFFRTLRRAGYVKATESDVNNLFRKFLQSIKEEVKDEDQITNAIARLAAAAEKVASDSKRLEDKATVIPFVKTIHKVLGDYITKNNEIVQQLNRALEMGEKAQKEIIAQLKEIDRVAKEVSGGMTMQSIVWPFPPSLLKIFRVPEADTKAALYEFYKASKAPSASLLDYIEPTLFVFSKEPRLLQLYHLRRRIDIDKANFIKGWARKWEELWMNVPSVSKSRIINAVEGRMDLQALSPYELLKLQQYRKFMAELAEQTKDSQGNPIKHAVGSKVRFAPEGQRRRIEWEIIGENLDHPNNRAQNPNAWTYRLRDARGNEITVPIEQIDSRFLPDYFPHRFRGNWVVYYPGAHIESTKIGIFDTIDDAVDYLMNNTSWDANGRPFVEVLNEMVKQGQAKDVVEAAVKLGVKIEPRFMIPDPFTIGLTPKQIGRLSQQILQELKDRGLVDQKGQLSTSEIYQAIREAGVQQRAGFMPYRKVRATMPRTAHLSTYLADPDEGFRIHIYQLASQMYSNEWRRSADPILKEFYNNVVIPNINNRRTVALWEFVNKWARDVDSYAPGVVEDWLNDLFEKMGVKMSATDLMREAAGWMSAIKLGNIVSPLINLTQTIITTYPVLGAKYTAKGLEALLKYFATRDPVLEDVLTKAGASIYSSVFTIQPFLPTKLKSGSIPEVVRGILLSPFSGAEMFNRGVAALGAYYKALENGVKDPITFARAVVDRTQGEYSKTGTAAILRGTIPAFILQFKKFFVLYIAFVRSLFRELSTEAGRLDPASHELARFLAASILTGGVLSLPFVGFIDRLLVRKYGISPLDIVREKSPELYDFLSRGLPALPPFRVDLSGRMGIEREIEDAISMFIDDQPISYVARISPWASTAYELFSAAMDVIKYQDDRSVDRFLSTVTPLGLWYIYITMKQKAAKALDLDKLAFEAPSSYMTVPGIYSVRTGRLLVKEPDDDPLFWTKKMLGFRTHTESIVSEAVDRIIGLAQRYATTKAKYERLILAAAMRGDLDEVDRLRQEALEKYGVPIEYDRVTALEALQEIDQLNRYFRRQSRETRQEAIEEASRILGRPWEPLPTRRGPAMVPRVPAPSLEFRF
jgi:hypothetical protein